MGAKKRGQISTEYIIIVSFILFLVLSTLGVAFFYSSQIQDTIKFNQIESFSKKIISSSESVYYAGAPSRTVINAYLPDGVNSIQIIDYDIVFNVSTNNGNAIVAYRSNVNLTGSISPTRGVKRIYLNATQNKVIVSG